LLLSSEFQAGDKVQVEVVQFGPLGATVEVIGRGHGDDAVLLDAEKEPLGTGLILQKEISYFRQARHMVDVVRGEILPAYVQNVRDEDGKLDIGLRAFGGKAKAQEVGDVILEILEQRDDGFLPVGDKSAPEDINRELPGVSKSAFKKAVGALYKKGLIQPSPYSLTLVAKK
jgi:predicted RNA-binding protein (virulence factor B family)